MGFFEKFRGNKEPAAKQEVTADTGKQKENSNDGLEQKNYQDIGRQRAENAKAAISGGLNSLKEKLGSGLSWLAQKAESAMYGALAAPEMTKDAAKAVGGAAVDAGRAIGGAVKTAGEYTAAAGVVGGRLAVEAGKSAVDASGRAIKATGEYLSDDWDQTKANALNRASAVIEGGKNVIGDIKAASAYVGEQAQDFKNRAGEFGDTLSAEWQQTKEAATEKFNSLKERGVNAAKSAWGKVDSAWSAMNNWKNDKRADLASKFSGVDKETLRSVSKLTPEQLQNVMKLASEMSGS